MGYTYRMNPVVQFLGDAEFGRVLEEHPKQVGYAFRNTANDAVKEIRDYARTDYSARFVERNDFSRKGIQADFARGHIIERVEAVVGGKINRPWLAKQEEGFTSHSAQASEHMRASGSYSRAVKRGKYLNRLQVRRTSLVPNKAITRQGKSMAMLAISARQGYGFPGSSQFFYFAAGELFGNTEEGYYQFAHNRLMHILGFPPVRLAYRLDNERRLRPEPWLSDAIEAKASPRRLVEMFDAHIKEQLRRFSGREHHRYGGRF